jgi:hypothetical protein
MDQATHIARAREALDAVERLLGEHAGRDADPEAQAAMRRHLGELRHLLAQLEGSEVPPGRGERADGARGADGD